MASTSDSWVCYWCGWLVGYWRMKCLSY